ncbi:MAG TPA: TetR/AcrR family transcriptional regulator [Cyclobacteriaceae bacterium]|nr:TetR/AcrR family transcriptional regulator [Cyclobacteriaceae bacterium]
MTGTRRTPKSEKWLEAAYELFAKEGAFGIQVERLARILNLNKSAYYHYFGSADQFMVELISYHKKNCLQLAQETSLCRNFERDFLRCVVKYKVCILFQGQLLRCAEHSSFNQAYRDGKVIMNTAILPLWCKFIQWEHDAAGALEFFNMILNSFYAGAHYENVTYRSLLHFMHDTVKLMQTVVRTPIRKQRSKTRQLGPLAFGHFLSSVR